jgi:hypothetical protein
MVFLFAVLLVEQLHYCFWHIPIDHHGLHMVWHIVFDIDISDNMDLLMGELAY